MGAPINVTEEINIEVITEDKEKQASAAFRAAWDVVKNKSRSTRRWVSKHGHRAISAGKTLTVASLIITAALLAQYIIAAGLMTVFSLSLLSAWWLAILPSMLLLLSTIGFTQDVIAASRMRKMVEDMPLFRS